MSEALSLPILTPSSLERPFYQGINITDAEAVDFVAMSPPRKPAYVLDSLRANSRSFLDCAHAIAQIRRERGEVLPPNLMVIEAINELKDRHPNIMAGGSLPGITLEHDSSDGGSLTITAQDELVASQGILKQKWRVSAFSERIETQRYEETRRAPVSDDFDDAVIIRGRQLSVGDAHSLQQLLQLEIVEAEPPEVELRLVPPISHSS